MYEVVPYAGQKPISVKWVTSEKNVNDTPIIKACLVALGYEEEDTVRSDSPTCYKENVCILLAIIASKSWKLHLLDIKTAFLQGRVMDRDVYLLPPSQVSSKGHVWKLKRCMYGLMDASREWYLRVRDEFLRLGGEVSSFDPALFYWRVGPDPRGILGAHADDFLHATEEVNRMKQVFKVGTEHSEAFQYLGLHLNQEHNCILLDQIKYISNVDLIEIRSFRKTQKKSDVACEEHASLQCGLSDSLIGPHLRHALIWHLKHVV